MGLPVEKPWFTVADYLRRKREAVDKHEHRNGEIAGVELPAAVEA